MGGAAAGEDVCYHARASSAPQLNLQTLSCILHSLGQPVLAQGTRCKLKSAVDELGGDC